MLNYSLFAIKDNFLLLKRIVMILLLWAIIFVLNIITSLWRGILMIAVILLYFVIIF